MDGLLATAEEETKMGREVQFGREDGGNEGGKGWEGGLVVVM